ncbi:formate/nitrite transporter family protein [Paenibacillus beijingensis]|uniref:Formate/nitrite transporter n=1 Tax=Paenibacillus beijingensis TaxID=1126833 RepID=A0A0D5NK46_9BACL|nr:formate/nitrite transporter family protein [Paenibacillus beijingensis]AJY75382.1 formate/nitrite transporter [Paenibacillus beijingensis]
MGFAKPEQIAQLAVEAGVKKANMPLRSQIPLGFAAGAFIALGFLLAIRVSAALPAEWGGLNSLLGAAVFPLGLILCLAAGGELLTGNMMALPMACYAGKVSVRRWLANWAVITAGNFLGALYIAYLFGHLGGMTEHGPYLARTALLARSKLDEPLGIAFISGIGCNWLVSSAVWMAYGSKDGAGMIAAVWFPTMAFVALGFQHVVANMFLLPAAIMAGQATWLEYARNFVPVYLGNAAGGCLFVAGIYGTAYLKKD